MLLKCRTQYVNKFGKLSSGHRTGKDQFSFQFQRRATPKNVQTTVQLHSYHMLVRLYSHLFKNFPQFVVIHTVKGCRVVNEAEVDVFLEFPCFLYDPRSVGNLISGSSAYSISRCTYGSPQFMYC